MKRETKGRAVALALAGSALSFPLGALTVAALFPQSAALAHTPYGQWQVYRKKHLLIGCHRENAAAYPLAKSIAATLAEHLPSSKARVARARHPGRLASLLATDQLQYAIIDATLIEDLAAGRGRFKPYGPIALRRIFEQDGHVLVARADVPSDHSWLLAKTLNDAYSTDAQTPIDSKLPWHDGADRYFRGLPIPHGDSH